MPFRRAPPTPTTQTGSTAASSSSVHRRLGNRSFNESYRAQDNSSSSSYQAPKAVASSSSSSSPSSLRVTSARNLSASASGAAAGAQLWGIGHKDFIVFEEAGVKLGKVIDAFEYYTCNTFVLIDDIISLSKTNTRYLKSWFQLPTMNCSSGTFW